MKDETNVPEDQAVIQAAAVPAEYARPPRYWIIGPDGRTPIGTDDLMQWSMCMEDRSRKIVRQDQDPGSEVGVSTVFLGLDHGFGSKGGPVLFETMVFGGQHDGEMVRYQTWEEAEAGHEVVCERLGINRKLGNWIDGEKVEGTEALTLAKDVTPKKD